MRWTLLRTAQFGAIGLEITRLGFGTGAIAVVAGSSAGARNRQGRRDDNIRTRHDPRQEMAEMSMKTDTGATVVRSLIPARLDRLPWTRFHTRLIMALGTAWILDGLEITLAGAVAGC